MKMREHALMGSAWKKGAKLPQAEVNLLPDNLSWAIFCANARVVQAEEKAAAGFHCEVRQKLIG